MTTVVGAGPTGWAPRDAATIAMITTVADTMITAVADTMITAVADTMITAVAVTTITAVATATMAGEAGTLRLTGPRRVVARRPPFPDGLEGTEFKALVYYRQNSQRFAGVTLARLAPIARCAALAPHSAGQHDRHDD